MVADLHCRTIIVPQDFACTNGMLWVDAHVGSSCQIKAQAVLVAFRQFLAQAGNLQSAEKEFSS